MRLDTFILEDCKSYRKALVSPFRGLPTSFLKSLPSSWDFGSFYVKTIGDTGISCFLNAVPLYTTRKIIFHDMVVSGWIRFE